MYYAYAVIREACAELAHRPRKEQLCKDQNLLAKSSMAKKCEALARAVPIKYFPAGGTEVSQLCRGLLRLLTSDPTVGSEDVPAAALNPSVTAGVLQEGCSLTTGASQENCSPNVQPSIERDIICLDTYSFTSSSDSESSENATPLQLRLRKGKGKAVQERDEDASSTTTSSTQESPSPSSRAMAVKKTTPLPFRNSKGKERAVAPIGEDKSSTGNPSTKDNPTPATEILVKNLHHPNSAPPSKNGNGGIRPQNDMDPLNPSSPTATNTAGTPKPPKEMSIKNKKKQERNKHDNEQPKEKARNTEQPKKIKKKKQKKPAPAIDPSTTSSGRDTIAANRSEVAKGKKRARTPDSPDEAPSQVQTPKRRVTEAHSQLWVADRQTTELPELQPRREGQAGPSEPIPPAPPLLKTNPYQLVIDELEEEIEFLKQMFLHGGGIAESSLRVYKSRVQKLGQTHRQAWDTLIGKRNAGNAARRASGASGGGTRAN